MEKVSVIIPAYNAATTIRRCITSLQQQVLQDFRVYIVDDCSTDDTWSILNQLALEDPRIIIFHQEQNQGPSAARNVALDNALGEWLCFIDSDDEISPNFLSSLVEEGESTGKKIVISSLRQVREDGTIIRELIADKYVTESAEDSLTISYGKEVDIEFLSNLCCTKIFRRELFNDVRFPAGRLQEDAFVTPFLIYNAKNGMAQAIDVFYIYYDNQNSISHTAQDGLKDMRRRMDLVYMYEQHIKLYQEHNNPLFLRSRSNLLNNIISIYQLHYSQLSEQYKEDFEYLHRVFSKHYWQGVMEHNVHLSIPLKMTWALFVLTPSLYLYFNKKSIVL